MNIAILGYGVEGQAAYRYWRSSDNKLTICDQHADLDLPDDVDHQLGNDYLHDLERFDMVVRTPGLSPEVIVNANSPAILAKVTSVTNEFMRVCPTRQVIGVTGTKGKGTTSTLLAQLLEAAGKQVHLGGNIGVPAISLLEQDIKPDDWVVLELSSFQLTDIKASPHIAVCLMVVPEHLNWHIDFEDYMNTKSQLFRYQHPEDLAIYYAANEASQKIASSGLAQKIPYYTEPGAVVTDDQITIDGHAICHVDELKLIGKHNWQNVCAAVTAAWQITQDVPALKKVLTSFSGLEHRLELVREVASVRYYDDSFGTTPETAIVAIQAFQNPKIIILGGDDKGAAYDELAQTVAHGNVRKALLIGNQADRIQTALEAANYHDFIPGGATMTEIVDTAQQYAQAGDVVLLSTGCASFDMFANYKDRGDQFRHAVARLS
jgi:UDP-N-acetylmuramoylalanine--D-glutamate ligase